MTNERDKEAMDELVSDTYSELPAPQTPEHLNQSILQMAASQRGGKDRSLFAAWIKPAAWATTIAFGLAIVLQLSELPTSAVHEVESAAPAAGLLEELVLEDKGKTDSFAASPAAAARPVARKLAADQPDIHQAAAEKKELDTVAACDTEARQSADDWLACIESLRESGAVELADSETMAFIRKYTNERTVSESNK